MKYRDIATIGCKLLGIYCAIQTVMLIPTSLGVFASFGVFETNVLQDGNGDGYFLIPKVMIFVAFAIYPLSALILLSQAERISVWLVRTDSEIPNTMSLDSETILRVLSQILGLYAILIWLPDLLQMLMRSRVYASMVGPSVPFEERFQTMYSYLIGPAVGSILGLLLLFRASGFIRLIRLARPLAKPSDPSAPSPQADEK